MKVTVRIHSSSGLEFKTRKVQQNNTVVLEKPGKHYAGWIAKIKGIEVKHLHFGRVKYFTDVWQGAKETWSYDYENKQTNQPVLTMNEVKQFAKTESFKWHFQGKPQGPSNAILYLILIVTVAMGLINILVVTGRLKI